MQHKKIQYLFISIILGLIYQVNLFSQLTEFGVDSLELKPKYGIVFGYEYDMINLGYEPMIGTNTLLLQNGNYPYQYFGKNRAAIQNNRLKIIYVPDFMAESFST